MLRGWDEGYEIPSFGVIVHPDQRRQGWGTLFLNWAIQDCKELGCEKIRLTVDKDNVVARKIYKRAGFKFKKKVGIKTL